MSHSWGQNYRDNGPGEFKRCLGCFNIIKLCCIRTRINYIDLFMRLVKQKGVGNMKNRVDCPVVTRMTLDFLMVTEHNGLDPGVNEE